MQGLKKRPETEGEASDSDEETSYDDNQCIGVSRGGRSTKIHAAVDALGNPVRIILSCGNTNDITMAQMLLSRWTVTISGTRSGMSLRTSF